MKISDKVYRALKDKGYKVCSSTYLEEEHLGICGFLESVTLVPFMIKYRSCQQGSDILFEVAYLDHIDKSPKNLHAEMILDGQDMTTICEKVLSLNRDGLSFWICSMNEIWYHARRMSKILLECWLERGTECIENKYGIIRIVSELNTRRRKIVLYIKPESLEHSKYEVLSKSLVKRKRIH